MSRLDAFDRRLDVLSDRLDTHINASLKAHASMQESMTSGKQPATFEMMMEQDVYIMRNVDALTSMVHSNNVLTLTMMHTLSEVVRDLGITPTTPEPVIMDSIVSSASAMGRFLAQAVDGDEAGRAEGVEIVKNIFAGFVNDADIDDIDLSDDEENFFNTDEMFGTDDDDEMPDPLEEGAFLYQARENGVDIDEINEVLNAALTAASEAPDDTTIEEDNELITSVDQARVTLTDADDVPAHELNDFLIRDSVQNIMACHDAGRLSHENMRLMVALFTGDQDTVRDIGFEKMPRPGVTADRFENGETDFVQSYPDEDSLMEGLMAVYCYSMMKYNIMPDFITL